MESQLHHPTTHGHHRHEEDLHHNAGLHSVMEGEGEAEHNHGDKRSVMKKVKDKAKKIKNTITGHGHEHDVDDDQDDETVVDPDVHGAAPTDFISGTALPKQTGPNLGKNQSSTPPVVDRQTRGSARNEVVYDDDDDVARVGVAMASDHHQGRPTIREDEVKKNSAPLMEDPYIPIIEEEEYSSGVGDMGVLKNSPPDPYIPNIGKEDYSSGVGDVGVFNFNSSPSPTLDDPYIPNIRSGVADIAPMSTDLLEPLPASRGPTTTELDRRAHVAEPVVKIAPMEDLEKDPHAPGATHPPNYQTKVADTTGQGGREADVTPLIERLCNLSVGEKSESMPSNTINPDSESMPRATVAGKISGVTSAIADKATSAKNAVASSLGYGSSQIHEGQEPSRNTAMGSLSEYGHTVAEKLAPVYGKAAGAGSALMSKVQGRGGDGVVKEGDHSGRGMSVQGYLAEKFTPGEEDKELSKVITDAIHRKKREGGTVEVEEEEPRVVKEKVRIEAVCSDEKTAAGVVDRVKGAIGSWLGSKQQGYGEDAGAAPAPGEGLDKEQVSSN